MSNHSTIDFSARRVLTPPSKSSFIDASDARPGTTTLATRVINTAPRLMRDSHRLRYQVYCLERSFLPLTDYPHGVESDDFDAHSVHVGAIDGFGCLAGTARLVLPYGDVLPTLSHCSFAPIERPLWGKATRWVEASRLSVSRAYGAARAGDRSGAGLEPRADRGHVFLAVLKALYQASKGLDATHWLVSIERSLQRLLSRNGFPFRQLGPEFDYLGPVAPYSLDLSELDEVIRGRQYPQLADFSAGLELGGGPDADDRMVGFPMLTPPVPTNSQVAHA